MQPTTEGIWADLSDDLRRFIRRRVADEHVAEDLLQETFTRVHRHLPTLEEQERVAAWVYRIARNVIHDHHRGTAIVPIVLDEDPVAAEPEDRLELLRRKVGGWLDGMIATLPDGYREAVQMSEMEGIPLQEVADRLGLSLSGAKSRVQRGRVMLKEVLEACCRFEVDVRGNVTDYEPKRNRSVCRDCDE